MNGLPTGWVESDVGALLLHSQNGLSARRGTGEPTVVLRLADVDSATGGLATDGLRRIGLNKKQRAKYGLSPGELLVFRVNGSRDIAGSVVEYLGQPGWTFCDHFMRFVPDTGVVDPSYLARAFRVPSVRHQVEREMVSTAGQNTVSQGTMKAVTVPVPPLNEQRRIVAKLDALQARSRRAREALDAIPALLDRFRQSVLAAAFRGDLTADWRAKNPDVEPASELLKRIRVERRAKWIEAEGDKARARARKRAEKKGQAWTDEDDAKALRKGLKAAEKKYVEPEPVDAEAEGLPGLPEGWCWATVEELNDPAAVLCYGVVQPGPVVEDGTSLVRVCDMVGGSVATSGLRTISSEVDEQYTRSRLAGGEVLVSLVGTVGRVAVVQPDAAGSNIARAIARITPMSELVPPKWLASWLSSPTMQHRLLQDAREVARKTLNLSELKRAPVPVAPMSEMRRCCSALGSVTSHGIPDAVRGAHRRLISLDQSILAKAFRGELVPQDPNDEPASVLLERIRAEREAAAPKKKKKRG